MEKFHGEVGRIKVVGTPGGMPKFEEKTYISRNGQCKKVEDFREGHGKIYLKSKYRYPQQGVGDKFRFGKAHLSYTELNSFKLIPFQQTESPFILKTAICLPVVVAMVTHQMEAISQNEATIRNEGTAP